MHDGSPGDRKKTPEEEKIEKPAESW